MEHWILKGLSEKLFGETAHTQLKEILQYMNAIRGADTQTANAYWLQEMLLQLHIAL